MAVLEVKGLTKRFGGVLAVDRVDLVLNQREACGLIGPNGAGKTTLFNCISGYYPPTRGRVVLADADITGWRANAVCKLGLARTFQTPRVFSQMTVLDSVAVGALLQDKSVVRARERAAEVLEDMGMAGKAQHRGDELTIADLKRLEIARALATSPWLLLLDETLAGLTPAEVQTAVRTVLKIKERGITILMVEHVMEALLPIVDRLVVLDSGQKIADGDPRQVLRDERVVRAYLGEPGDVAG